MDENQSEKAFILRETIQNLIPVIARKYKMYEDLIKIHQNQPRTELSKNTAQFNLNIANNDDIFTKKPARFHYSDLETQYSKLEGRFKQVLEERKQRQSANTYAVNTLNYEIESLRKEIKKYSQNIKYPHISPSRKRIIEQYQQIEQKTLPL